MCIPTNVEPFLFGKCFSVIKSIPRRHFKDLNNNHGLRYVRSPHYSLQTTQWDEFNFGGAFLFPCNYLPIFSWDFFNLLIYVIINLKKMIKASGFISFLLASEEAHAKVSLVFFIKPIFDKAQLSLWELLCRCDVLHICTTLE